MFFFFSFLSVKWQRTVKHAQRNPESKVTSSNVSFCPIENPKPKDVQFSVLEKQKTLTLEKLEAEDDRNDQSIIRIVVSMLSWQAHIDSDPPQSVGKCVRARLKVSAGVKTLQPSHTVPPPVSSFLRFGYVNRDFLCFFLESILYHRPHDMP